MNTTLTHTTTEIIPDYLAITGWALFLLSEAMPFLKKKETFNGLLHTIICLANGSKCMAEKALLNIEGNNP